MRLHWWSYSQKFWLLCYSAQLKMVVHCNLKVKKKKKKKNIFFILHSHYFNYFIDFFSFFFSLFFLFLFFHLCSFVSLVFSTLSFSCSFLFSKLSLYSQNFHSNSFLFLLKFSLSFSSIFSLLCEGLFFCRVGVVGHRHRGHAVSMVSHWLWVMLWVWVRAVVFMGLAVGFVWWVIGAMVMSWVWWVIGFGSCHGCGLPWVLFLWLWVDFLG